MVSNKEIIDCTIDYDSGCQHYAKNVTKFTFVNGRAFGRRYNDGRGRVDHSVSSSLDPSGLSRVDVTSAPLITVPFPVERQAVEIDSSCVIHPFYIHKMDSGPVRLMTIAHAFNYRVAVLRNGVRSAVRVGRSERRKIVF